MGSGKTSWSIQHINESPFENVLYITPFLNEVERIIENTNRDFKQPSYKGGTKLQNLNELLACQCDIASTHELFKKLNEESREYIQNGHYTLILDEVLNAIDPYDDIKKDDMKLLQDSGCITIDEDGFVIWNQDKAEYDTQYNKIKILAENKSLLYVNQKLLLWRYPPEIFTLFDKVYILTYLFDASILKNYFDLYHIQYIKKSITYENGKYVLSDFFIPDTKKYLNNYFRNILDAKSETILWTSFKDYKTKLRGKGYAKEFKTEQLNEVDNAYGFLACNARATNKYAQCYNLAYCVNIYLHPAISQFFLQKGIKVNEDLFGLSEMIQWIWRSRIRNGEKINIYIPSTRMRTLLKSWLDMSLEYQNEKAA